MRAFVIQPIPMKTVRRMLLASLFGLAAILPSWAQTPGAAGVEVAGVRYAPTAVVGNATLQLNGAGVRYKAIFKVYAAGLYLGSKATTR